MEAGSLRDPATPSTGVLARRGSQGPVLGSALVDLTLLLLPPLSLGLLVTAHLAIVIGLLGQRPRWRALAAFLVPPLAVVWGFKAEMTGWCRVWLGAALVYAITLVVALES